MWVNRLRWIQSARCSRLEGSSGWSPSGIRFRKQDILQVNQLCKLHCLIEPTCILPRGMSDASEGAISESEQQRGFERNPVVR